MDERVFISYARADSDFALKLAQDLRDANVEAWIDVLDIHPGDIWDHAVEDALQACSKLLLVLSPASVASRPVMDEVSFAFEENKRILPVIFQECKIPFRLRRVQYTDFTSEYSTAFSKLLDALCSPKQENLCEQKVEMSYGEVVKSGVADNSERSKVSAPEGTSGLANKSHRPALRFRILTALSTVVAGAVISGVFILLYFDTTKRSANVISLTVTALFAGVVLGITSLVISSRRLPFVLAVISAPSAVIGWLVIFGTYTDYIAVAILFGAPVGALVGATIGAGVLRWRGGA